jgi:syntaxin-binding protein 1
VLKVVGVYSLSRYKFQSSVGAYEDKTATLSDSDTVWTEVRHMHMKEAIDKLMSDFNKFLEENAVFKGYVHPRWFLTPS